MNKEVLDFVMEKTHELIDAATCSSVRQRQQLKAGLQQLEQTKKLKKQKNYVAELEEDIMPIDTLIAFAESDAGAQVFGADAAGVAAHAKEIKSAGANYCDCPACNVVAEILEKKELLLK